MVHGSFFLQLCLQLEQFSLCQASVTPILHLFWQALALSQLCITCSTQIGYSSLYLQSAKSFGTSSYSVIAYAGLKFQSQCYSQSSERNWNMLNDEQVVVLVHIFYNLFCVFGSTACFCLLCSAVVVGTKRSHRLIWIMWNIHHRFIFMNNVKHKCICTI